MAKKGYVGVGGVARKLKKGYVGVGGVARRLKKAYIGVGGVARPCWSGGELSYYGTAAALTNSVAALPGTTTCRRTVRRANSRSSSTLTLSASSFSPRLIARI